MRLVAREPSKNEPRNELDSLGTRLVSSLHSMSVPPRVRVRHLTARREGHRLEAQCAVPPQQSGAPPRILLDPAVTDTRSLPAAPPQPRSSMRSTGHALLDFRYQPYDPGAAASTAAHPAYEIAGTVAGGTYAFGHIGGRRGGH